MDNYATGSFTQHPIGLKKILRRSAAEITYGMKLRLPGDFTENNTVGANTDLENYSDRLRVAMSRLRLSPPARHTS